VLKISDDRHDGITQWRTRFESGHLPDGLPRLVMGAFEATAQVLVDSLPDGPLLTEALRDLWHAKNTAVLHAVESQRKLEALERAELRAGQPRVEGEPAQG
jgi:hypothetical protein